MKKLISIILTITLFVSMLFLVACGKVKDGATVERLATKTPSELYASEMNAISKAYAYSILTTQVVTQSTSNGTKTTTDTVINETDGYNAYSKVQSDTNSSLNLEAWCVDGTLYTYLMGKKSKTSYSIDTFFSKYMNGNTLNSSLLKLESTAFADTVFVRKDGLWTIQLTLSGADYSKLISTSNTPGTLTRLPNSEVVYDIYFNDDGKLQKVCASYDVNVAGVKSRCTITTSIRIGNINISAPADASNYQSVNLPN